MKIILTGGGSGGHLIPLFSIIEEIKKKDPNTEIVFVGPKNDLNNNFEKMDVKVFEICSGKLRRYFSLDNFFDIFRLMLGIIQAIILVRKISPDVIFSKGGFASVPISVAGKLLGVPILTHESDRVPGLANQIIAEFSTKIFLSFPESKKCFPKNKAIFSGNPVREDITQGDKKRGAEFLGFDESIPVIMIFGGSQGAKFINELLFETLGDILKEFEVIHICGKKNFKNIKGKFNDLNIKNKGRYNLFSFIGEEMKDLYAVSDFVVSRAGANSLAEIVALEKPSFIIPLATAANNHQYHNAKHFSDGGLLIFEEEKELNGKEFLNRIEELKKRKEDIIGKIEEYNKNWGGKKPVEVIVDEIMKFKK